MREVAEKKIEAALQSRTEFDFMEVPLAAAIEVSQVPPGLHMLTAGELDDESVARIRHYRPRFEAAAPPDPDRGRWGDWPTLLGSREYASGEGPLAAMDIQLGDGFGTVCSQLVAIPRYPGFETLPRFAFGLMKSRLTRNRRVKPSRVLKSRSMKGSAPPLLLRCRR